MLVRLTRSTLLRATTVVVLAGSLTACADAVQPVTPAHDVSNPALSVTDESGGTWLVRFMGSGIPAGFEAAVTASGGEVVFAHADAGIAAVAGLTDAGATQLAAIGGVASVDADAYTEIEAIPDLLPELAGTTESPAAPATALRYARQWNMHTIEAKAAWDAGFTGKPTTKVGILDTGIDYLHPDLFGRVDMALSRSFLNAAENARVQAAFPGAHPVADLNYHGTHVAATVASNAYIYAGVSSNVTLVGLKVCAPGTAANGFRGTCPTSGTLSAILYAADNGIPVINMSLGGTFNRRDASAAGGFGPSFLATINQVMSYANQKGTLVVVSAGNSALDIDHDGNGYKSYCSAPHVVCVSATGPTGATGPEGPWANIDALAYYSNYGRSAISVGAPGGNAVSVSAACSGFTVVTSILVCRNRYFNSPTSWSAYSLGVSGTSMAAPHVSGLAGLIAGEVGNNPAMIRARIQQGADDLGEVGTDPAYGSGRINVRRSLGG